MDGSGEQPEHAARALERAERSSLFSQHFKQLRMERVAAAELVAKLWACRIGRQSVFVGIPDLVVGGEYFLRCVEIDRLKQACAEDVGRLVFFRRVEGRGASNGDA